MAVSARTLVQPSLEAFDFALPEHLIAQRPASPRDAARLLVVDEILQDQWIHDLPLLLRPGDLLVVNDTRVIPARLFGYRGTVAVEVTLLEPASEGRWRALAKPGRRLAPGDVISFSTLAATVADKDADGAVILDFGCDEASLALGLQREGAAPLPPYIRRNQPDPRDRDDYQTIFASQPGAVAAPTAGLHFTDSLLQALDRSGIARTTITLHVGAGTFLPIRTEHIEEHVMHAERGEVSAAAAAMMAETRARGGRIIAVGTTVLRLLETACDDAGYVRPWQGETRLFIRPGFRIRTADLLLTNFHLPRSTLFMLVAAFAGLSRMRAAYAHAIADNYRFYSYGDATLLSRSAPMTESQ